MWSAPNPGLSAAHPQSDVQDSNVSISPLSTNTTHREHGSKQPFSSLHKAPTCPFHSFAVEQLHYGPSPFTWNLWIGLALVSNSHLPSRKTIPLHKMNNTCLNTSDSISKMSPNLTNNDPNGSRASHGPPWDMEQYTTERIVSINPGDLVNLFNNLLIDLK